MSISLQIATSQVEIPAASDFEQWVQGALAGIDSEQNREVCIRIVDSAESADLNQRYRNKAGPTNVLAFPSEPPPGLPDEARLELGDLIICAPLVQQEAAQQDKSVNAHWAHLVVHGTLHLLGYDHISQSDAEAMESLEVAILAQLRFPHPYQSEKAEAP